MENIEMASHRLAASKVEMASHPSLMRLDNIPSSIYAFCKIASKDERALRVT